MVNSYILYKDTVASPKSHVAYRRSVIESIASRHISMSPSRPCVNGRLHIIDIRKQRSCVVCNYTGKKVGLYIFAKAAPKNHSSA